MLANKLYIADFMKNYHNEIANLLENGLEVNFTESLSTYISIPMILCLLIGSDLCWRCWLYLQLAWKQEVGESSGMGRQRGIQCCWGWTLAPDNRFNCYQWKISLLWCFNSLKEKQRVDSEPIKISSFSRCMMLVTWYQWTGLRQRVRCWTHSLKVLLGRVFQLLM